MIVLGIDPGQEGGFAVVSADEKLKVVGGLPTPLMEVRQKVALDMKPLNRWLLDCGGRCDYGVIELVHAMPKQGVSSSFQFGRMFGAAELWLSEACDTWEHVIPRTWKTKMGLSDKKAASLDLATRMFGRDAASKYWPLKKHEGVAEAALIAAYWIRHVNK